MFARNNQHDLYVERRDYGRTVQLHITQRNENQELIAVAAPVEMVPATDDSAASPPMLSLDWLAAQQLADKLWAQGIRPSQAEQSEGQHGAMNAHLQDLRAIVASFAEVDLPGISKGQT